MNAIMTNAARVLTICVAVTLGFSAVEASAGTSSSDPVTGARKEVVRFADLDLSGIEGVARLYGRIAHAARDVCDPLFSTPQQYGACADKAIGNAVAAINRPLLSQYHQLRTKGDKAGLMQLARAH